MSGFIVLKRAFLLISPFLFQFMLAQEGYLKHFEKKVVLKEIILPKDKFQHGVFSILLPKEIYNSGEIELKKPRIKAIKLTSIKLWFERNQYSKMLYCAKKKNSSLLSSFFKKQHHGLKKKKITHKKEVCYQIES